MGPHSRQSLEDLAVHLAHCRLVDPDAIEHRDLAVRWVLVVEVQDLGLGRRCQS